MWISTPPGDPSFFFFQAEDGIRDFCLSRGLGDVYKIQGKYTVVCKDGFISEKGLGTMYGPEISVPAQSALIFYK